MKNSLKIGRTFEVGLVFSTWNMCFVFSCFLYVIKVYGGAALRSFRRWVVWCLDNFFFVFWIRNECDFISFYLFAFAVSVFFQSCLACLESWIFLSCMHRHALAGSDISSGKKRISSVRRGRCDRVGSPMVSGSVVLPFFDVFCSSISLLLLSFRSQVNTVEEQRWFGNTAQNTWIMQMQDPDWKQKIKWNRLACMDCTWTVPEICTQGALMVHT